MNTTLPTMDPPLSSQFYTDVLGCNGHLDRERAVIWENEQKAWQEKKYLSCLGHALLSRIVNLSCLLTTPIDLCLCTVCSVSSIYNCLIAEWVSDYGSCVLLKNGFCILSVNNLALACLKCAQASVQTCCCPMNLICPEMYNLYCLERIDLSLNQQEYHRNIELDDLFAAYANYRNSASTTTQVNITAPVVIVMK